MCTAELWLVIVYNEKVRIQFQPLGVRNETKTHPIQPLGVKNETKTHPIS